MSISDDHGGPASFFDGHPVAFAVFERVRLPGQYLRAPAAPVVLSIALGRRDGSPRFKDLVHPSPRHWMHHLEIDDPDAIDDEVAGWLREAAERAG